MSAYCQAAPGHPFHGPYHDHEYGFPVSDDNVLFERLVLELNQAGLSWMTILKKRENFRKAFSDFDIAKVAAFTDKDKNRLLKDIGIVRNHMKIEAAIWNAQKIISLQETHGSFHQWLESQHPLSKDDWVKLFKKTFRFTGGEITGEFLMSIGYLPGAHHDKCPVYKKILTLNPPWRQGKS